MNIEINETDVLITNTNDGGEKHGTEEVTAKDVNVTVNMPVEFLSKFSENDKDWAKTCQSVSGQGPER